MTGASALAANPLETPLTIGLVGNPNCGKTALFNALTGLRQKVANYAGVTVERKEGLLVSPSGAKVMVIDLPGTYSLRARSPDEAVTRDVVLGRRAGEAAPDILVCVGDATNLRLTLRLVLELKSVGRPLILALNMADIAERQGLRIDVETLSQDLGVPIISTVATRKRGIDQLALACEALGAQISARPASDTWRQPSLLDVKSLQARADQILKRTVSSATRPDIFTDRLDKVLLHPVFGVVFLLGLLFVMFQAVFTWAQPLMEGITGGFSALGDLVAHILPSGLLQSLIVDGVIAGVGSVVAFVPQISILFCFIILLEDTGYMARAAFLMDRLMGAAGLHGRAFIPLLSSFACAVPGIMGARVIDHKRDRFTTILIAPLMTCSARIPVYTLIIAAFVPHRKVFGLLDLQGLVLFGLYAAGILGALAVAALIRGVFWRGASEPFVMELPAYKRPELKVVLFNVAQKAGMFLHRAGTTILAMMILIWFLSRFPEAPLGATHPAITYSFAGQIGRVLVHGLGPIGFNWEMAVALVPGLAAREVAVGALATVYAIEGGEGARHMLGGVLAHQWSLAQALAFLAWYVFAPQCAATLGAIRRETGSWIWPVVTFAYMVSLAWLLAYVVFHAAVALGWG